VSTITPSPGYRTQAEDTSPEAERILIEAWRAMEPWEKFGWDPELKGY